MSDSPPTNVVNSLKLVRAELLATIEIAAKDIEVFFGNTTDGGRLQQSIESLQQISGTLAMLQMEGPQCLSDALLAVAQDITPGENAVDEATVHALTGGFFLLPRYLEFLQNTNIDRPQLLLPHINELRACSDQPPLMDSYFFSVPQYPKSVSSVQEVTAASSVEVTDRGESARRLRHMYQIGLVAVLQNKPMKPPLNMMCLALERLANLYNPEAIATLCSAASLALKTSLFSHCEMTKNRKLALINLEKTLRRMHKIDPDGKSTLLPRPLAKEFIYWCAVNPGDEATDLAVSKLLSVFGVTRPEYTVDQLHKEAELLAGPSLSTIQSVISVFEEEIEAAKRMLELGAEAEDYSEFGELEKLLNKLTEILSMVGLSNPSTRLKEQAQRVAEIAQGETPPEKRTLSDIADALLHIENSVISFKNQAGYKTSDAEESSASMVDHQLAQAELIVLSEAENGLTVVKRALSAFAESNFDRVHIANVAKTLGTIKGGMMLMHRSRCAQVVGLAEQFIEQELMTQEHPSVLQQLLETFADCVISLEYYITALQTDKNTDDGILQIAEESLTALGVEN